MSAPGAGASADSTELDEAADLALAGGKLDELDGGVEDEQDQVTDDGVGTNMEDGELELRLF